AASPFHHIRSGGVYAARSGCKPLPLSCSGRALRAQEHDVPFAARLRNSLAAKDRRQHVADGLNRCAQRFLLLRRLSYWPLTISSVSRAMASSSLVGTTMTFTRLSAAWIYSSFRRFFSSSSR